MMQIMKLRTAVALFLLSFLLVLPGVSQGHAFPDHSDPKVGATVSGSPSNVRIWFDGDLEPVFSTISVQNAGREKGRQREWTRESVQCKCYLKLACLHCLQVLIV